MPGHFEYDGKIEVKDKDSGTVSDWRPHPSKWRGQMSPPEIDFVLDETTLLRNKKTKISNALAAALRQGHLVQPDLNGLAGAPRLSA
ncbi:MAG: hypothetical protein ACLRXC_07860 [[Clostridium] leptum]